jgi:hypothetical protein
VAKRPLAFIRPPKPISEMTEEEKDAFFKELGTQVATAYRDRKSA